MTTPNPSEELERLVGELIGAAWAEGYEQGHAEAQPDDGLHLGDNVLKRITESARKALIEAVKRSHYCCVCGRTLDGSEDSRPLVQVTNPLDGTLCQTCGIQYQGDCFASSNPPGASLSAWLRSRTSQRAPDWCPRIKMAKKLGVEP